MFLYIAIMAPVFLFSLYTSWRVKSRYKELVKQYHPDTNGGDKEAEEKIKEINEAYQIIMEMLAP